MFRYKTKEELFRKCRELGVSIPYAEDYSVLRAPLTVCGKTVPNRIAIQPMEGCDGTPSGSPDEHTIARYERFANSGAGLIWFEATAITEDGRANPRQLAIREDNWEDFRRLTDHIREITRQKFGYEPILILQATHSGRYAKPTGVPAPIIAYNNPIFEGDKPIDKSRIITDDALRALEEGYSTAAVLARKAGFDGIDVKCCHRYLCSELLSAYERPGDYGGSFENRTRFLRNSFRNAREAVPADFIVTSRMNLYDGFPYPYGFGVSPEGGTKPELSETVKLVGLLKEMGLGLLDATIGNPYFNPHVNRPADWQPYELTEDPLVGVERMLNCIRTVQTAYPDLTIIGSGTTYMREYQPNVCAGAIENGYYGIAGWGRQAFAYPGMIEAILLGEAFDPKKCCITCGGCTKLMRLGTIAGCAVRDPFYAKLLREKQMEAKGK